MRHTREQIQFLDMVPADRSIGNQALREALGWDEHQYERVRCELLQQEAIVLGKGRGGSVRRPDADEQRLLRMLPEDGSFRTNASVMDELDWPSELYWEVRGALQEKGLVRLGTGHGGRVARVVPEHSEDLADDDEEEDSVDETDECTRPNSMGAAYDEYIQNQTRILRALRLHDWSPGQWTYPREIGRVLEAVGFEVPQRLRTQRFCELLTILDNFGIEMRLADEEDELLTIAHKSPGIDARVRLRRRASAKPVETHRNAPRPAPAPQDSPNVAAPLPPIQIVPSNNDPAKATATFRPKVPHYTLALLKLQFLTAIPSIDRQHSLDWPSSFLEAAQRGLVLQPPEVRLLNTVIAGMVRGQHSPFEVISDLAKYVDAADWAQLVDDLRRLNPAMPDAVEDIAHHLKVERRLPVSQPHAISRAAHMPPMPSPARAPVAASGGHLPSRVSSVKTVASNEAAPNNRSLGALDDIFDDFKKA